MPANVYQGHPATAQIMLVAKPQYYSSRFVEHDARDLPWLEALGVVRMVELPLRNLTIGPTFLRVGGSLILDGMSLDMRVAHGREEFTAEIAGDLRKLIQHQR